MRKYIYPAVIFEDKSSSLFTVLVPDLDIITSGETIEQAYERACDYLSAYLKIAIKFEAQIAKPTSFLDVQNKNPKRYTILISAEIDGEKIELTSSDIAYKKYLKSLVD